MPALKKFTVVEILIPTTCQTVEKQRVHHEAAARAMKRAAANRDHPVLGILLKLAAVVLFGGMAACVKYVGQDIPIGEMIFVRGIISLAALALIAWRTAGLQVLRTQNWRSHALRSLAGTGAMFAWFMALTLIPME